MYTKLYNLGMTVGLLIGAAIVLILVFFYYQWSRRWSPTSARAGAVDREWNMVRDFENKKEAAELLAKVHTRALEFMRFLKKKYHIDEPDDVAAAEGAEHQRIINAPHDVYNIIDHLLDNYNPEVFFENDPRGTTETSYTLNKGAAMYICLRRKDNPSKLVDENDLFFVLLHEISHIANYRGWGHGTDFWEVFAFILHEAQLSGVYQPVDYSKKPINYCGLRVAYNPLFDNSLRKIWVN